MTVPKSIRWISKHRLEKLNYIIQDVEPLIRYMPPYGDNAPFWLIIGNDTLILDSSYAN